MAEKSPEAKMPSLEERVSYLEGKSEDHGRGIQELRDMVSHLDQKMDRRFDAVDRGFESVDQKFTTLDQKFTALDQKIDRVHQTLDTKISWVVGIQVALLLAVIGALLR
jgi:prefoldin subunit 5